MSWLSLAGFLGIEAQDPLLNAFCLAMWAWLVPSSWCCAVQMGSTWRTPRVTQAGTEGHVVPKFKIRASHTHNTNPSFFGGNLIGLDDRNLLHFVSQGSSKKVAWKTRGSFRDSQPTEPAIHWEDCVCNAAWTGQCQRSLGHSSSASDSWETMWD